MRKKIILILTLYVGLVLLGTNVYAASGKLLNDNTRIREEASTDSEIIDLVSQGENVEIISEEGEWYKVKYNAKTGYIRKDMIELVNNEETSSNEASNSSSDENNNQEEKEDSKSEKNNESLIQKGYAGKLNSKLQIKLLPTINSSVIANVDENTNFTVSDIINKWCYIETDTASGWVLLSKINYENSNTTNVTSDSENKDEDEDEKEQEQEKEEEKTSSESTKTIKKYVSTEVLNLREQPENSSEVIKGLAINTEVTVLETVDSTWSKVTAKGSTGYVASKFLSDTKIDTSSRSENEARTNNENRQNEQENIEAEAEENEEPAEETTTTSSNSSLGNEIVAYAKQFLGNPYVYGGTSLTNGCDCSGFVMSVYKHFGYSLPRSSGSMQGAGRAVSKSELQPGDILCFSGHVGIYMGNNTFIHAANPQKGIITTSLSSSYYVSKYICARRVI